MDSGFGCVVLMKEGFLVFLRRSDVFGVVERVRVVVNVIK